jgi:tRNA 2-thiouridine synthesizing protein D
MGKLTIGCFSSLVGSMTADFALKLADAVVKKGHTVDIWLSGNGTTLVLNGQKEFKDYSYNLKRLKSLIERGVTITACEACAESRGIGHDATVEGVKRHSMDWYLASTFSANRVLHIGGE